MRCPHCGIGYFKKFKRFAIGVDIEGPWNYLADICPECKKLILCLEYEKNLKNTTWSEKDITSLPPKIAAFHMEIPGRFMVKPSFGCGRPPCPPEVPKEFAEDYNDACNILRISPRASAALSRRCLQHILRERAGVKHGRLKAEITEAKEKESFPSYITKVIDAPRKLGNLSAHPNYDEEGMIIDVEPSEAEWVLDIIEMLLDHYFVKPAEADRRVEELNKKYSHNQ